VSVEGTVSAAFPGADGLGGFFIQDPVGDADPATSDGLFIAAGDAAPTVGERVQVVGTVVEHFGQTQLGEVSDVQLCGPGEAVRTTALSLPAPAGLEHLEGMLVNLPDTLSISDVHDLGRFGELLLAAGGRLMIPSNQVDPDAVNDLARDNLQRRILLDDGSNRRNVVPPYQLADGRPPRVGDSVGGLSGVLGYAFGDYRIQPLAAPVFTPANSRPLEPPAVGGRLRVASFNVLNYFISLGQRGADTPEELQRQADKLVAALAALEADIVGLVEVENTRPDADAAVTDLVARLNAVVDEDTYAVVPAPAWTGEDAIRTALIYRPDRVTPVGAARSSDPARDPAYRVLKRPAMAQIFEADGERFTVVVNHFKSKGGCLDDAADPDADHGQGCWNALRSQQARALLAFAEELTTLADDPDVLVLGDLNAYGREDPIDILRAGGLIDQLAVRLDPMARYTYVYDGASGYLDHVLTSASLNPRVGGLTVWHINADEPPVLDYRADNPAGLYRSDPFRSSDHDPVLIGLFPVAPVPEPQEDGQIADYYAPVVDLSGPALRAGLHALIRDHQQLAYGAAWRVLAESDAEPDTPDTVRLVYALRAQPVDFSARGNNDPDAWNREHVWPRSRGLGSTGRRGPATDIHNLKPADASINSARGNLDFDGDGLPHEECSACLRDDDSWSPPVGQRGDIARIAFYMDLRYEGGGDEPDLLLVPAVGEGGPHLGRLCTLLDWHREDPVDAFERRRNGVIAREQGNRNPFVDRPGWVDELWGGDCR